MSNQSIGKPETTRANLVPLKALPLLSDRSVTTNSQLLIERLISMRYEMQQWDEEECKRFIASEKLTKEWAKLQQESASVLIELERAKATALRRLATFRTDAMRSLSNAAKSHAGYLAALSVQDFHAFIDRCRATLSLIAVGV